MCRYFLLLFAVAALMSGCQNRRQVSVLELIDEIEAEQQAQKTEAAEEKTSNQQKGK